MTAHKVATSNDLVAITDNNEVLAFYGANQDVGVEDVENDVNIMPRIKITAAMSKSNILHNGKKSVVGKLYHTELKQDFDELDTVFLAISKARLPKYDPKREPNVIPTDEDMKLNYLIGGFNLNDTTPFLIYVRGLSIQPMWDFLKDLSSIKTRFKLPIFALKVKISVQLRDSKDFGQVECFKFDIARDESGKPLVETDIGRLIFYRDAVEGFKKRFAAIASKGITEEDDFDVARANETPIKEAVELLGATTEDVKDPNSLSGKYQQVLDEKRKKAQENNLSEVVDANDIPF